MRHLAASPRPSTSLLNSIIDETRLPPSRAGSLSRRFFPHRKSGKMPLLQRATKNPSLKADAGRRALCTQPGVNSSTGFASGEIPKVPRDGLTPVSTRAGAADIHLPIIARQNQSVNGPARLTVPDLQSGKTAVHPSRNTVFLRLQKRI